MKFPDSLFSRKELAANKSLFAVTALVLLYGGVFGFQNRGNELSAYLALLFFAAWLCRDGLKHALPRSTATGVPETILSWGILVLMIPLLLLPGSAGNPVVRTSCLLGIALALVCRAGGWRAAVWMALPYAACFFLLPYRTMLMLYISYPMRMISTIVSAGLLGLFDSGVSYVQTTIYLSGTKIGITDACSGIAQIEAMFLLAYWIVGRWKRSLFWKVLHYLFLFPAIMIANGIRIIVTILLFYWIGDVVFGDFLHVGLGYAQVFVSIGLFYLAGYVLPEQPAGETKK